MPPAGPDSTIVIGTSMLRATDWTPPLDWTMYSWPPNSPLRERLREVTQIARGDRLNVSREHGGAGPLVFAPLAA